LLEVPGRGSVYAILTKSPRAAEIWQTFERGVMYVLLQIYEQLISYATFFYSAWHLEQERYKLKDLGL
jgi:hypothetical protein